jgi:ribosome-associated toxin RatA of RatAB toxin-antitoxin module
MSGLHSRIGIAMAAAPEQIFPLAVEVERWPERLPHYRYVRRLAGAERRFAMGARRGAIPVRWEAIQRPRPQDRIIEFVHTGGVTRGMQVAWRIEPRDDGSGVTEVSIEHELELRWPLIGGWVARHVIGPHFVEAIAGRTLRRIRELAEATDR